MKLISYYLLAIVFILSSIDVIWAQPRQYVNGSVGLDYTSIMHGIDHTKIPGGVGYNIGASYEMRFEKLLLNTGVEFSHLNSVTRLYNYVEEFDFLYPQIENHYLTYYYNFSQYREKHSVGYLNIPLYAGYKTDKFYAMAGVKLGINLFGNYKTKAILETTATDPMFIDTLSGMPNHYLDKKEFVKSAKFNAGLNIVPGIEIGAILDEWIYGRFRHIRNYKRPPFSYRAGVFVDYGLSDINTTGRDLKILTDPGNHPLDVDVNGLMASEISTNKRFGTFMAGLKFTLSYDITKAPKKKIVQPLVPQVLPLFNVKVTDEDTGQPVIALVSVSQNPGNRLMFKRQTDKNGFLRQQLRAGKFRLNVVATGYMDYLKEVDYNKTDTFVVSLQTLPVELIVRVIDSNTKKPINAKVEISKDQSKLQEYIADTLNGTVKEKLKKGNYTVGAVRDGYLYAQKEISILNATEILLELHAIQKEKRVVIENLFFELNSAVLMSQSSQTIDKLYSFMKENSNVRIRIVGHTDNTGSINFNNNLSLNRANSVRDALIEKGIGSERIIVEGKGSAEPVDTNDTEEGRSRNRRVEFEIL